MKGVRPYAIDKDNALRLWKVAAEMAGLPQDALGVQFRTS